MGAHRHRLPGLLALASLAVTTGCFSSSTGATSRYPEPIPTAASGPVLFSPGYVSSGLSERDASFAPDGDVFAFTLIDGRRGRITLLELGKPTLAPFTGEHSDIEPFYDPRGGWLWFASDRPHPDDPERSDWNIWRVPISEDDEFGEPEIVRGLDAKGDEFYPSVALDGTVAFTSKRGGGMGDEDIWLAVPADGAWFIENAGPGVNTAGPEFNALLTPDGRMLVFSSVRDGDLGAGDLYVSTRRWDDPIAREATADGEDAQAEEAIADVEAEPYFVVDATFGPDFGEAVALEPYNSEWLDYCPAVTPDGKYLVFTSRRIVEPKRKRETFPQMTARLTGPGNGNDDLWWAPMPVAR